MSSHQMHPVNINCEYHHEPAKVRQKSAIHLTPGAERKSVVHLTAIRAFVCLTGIPSALTIQEAF